MTIQGRSGQETCVLLEGGFDWREDPDWYRQFFYSEEAERGYMPREDLYSAGVFAVDLRRAPGGQASWLLSESQQPFAGASTPPPRKRGARSKASRPAVLDFVLLDPPGIVAGYPWFGEWGRDTFISLPGIAMAWIEAGGDPAEVWEWAEACLMRWGDWIRMTGMIPNLIEKDGSHQWESADGTLWWCHALASLWTFSLGDKGLFPGIEEKFRDHLACAISAISSGRHLFLSPSEDGSLEVTEPHSTWMDARIDGAAVTPRMGKLPEINALWFQARCLQWIWSSTPNASEGAQEIGRLGRLALACVEADRPNGIFLHSIPLAPSFVLKDSKTMASQLQEIAEQLWTPVGLRTLSPRNPAYRPRCVGDQLARDLAYHQGPPWAWLGGHFEMARQRCVGMRAAPRNAESGAPSPLVAGHIPELFDAEPPFAPRGTPAQAWSVACLEEASARRRAKVDAKLTRLLAERWLERRERREGMTR
jgi:glycogen debranching enzyme